MTLPHALLASGLGSRRCDWLGGGGCQPLVGGVDEVAIKEARCAPSLGCCPWIQPHLALSNGLQLSLWGEEKAMGASEGGPRRSGFSGSLPPGLGMGLKC